MPRVVPGAAVHRRGVGAAVRYTVLGAWNAVTRRLIRVSNDTRVSSDTMTELLGRIAGQVSGAVTLVPDNARTGGAQR